MKFKLEIEMGNEEMNEPAALAEALEQVAEKLYVLDASVLKARGFVPDANGNIVGKWMIGNNNAKL